MKKLLIIVIICLTGNLSAQGLLNNLRACYPLDCSAVNNATTGPIYDGYTGSACWCATGHTGLSSTAYQFSGNGTTNGIAIQNTSLLDSPTDICFSAWFKVTGLGYLVFRDGGPTPGSIRPAYGLRAFQISPSATTYAFLLEGGMGSPGNLYLTSSQVYNFGTWYHVVFYVNTTSGTLWINNSLVQSINRLPAIASINYASGYPIVLGNISLSGGSGNAFVGAIDNVRFYDRALTSSEIADLYNNDPTCNSSGTVPTPTVTPIGNYCANPTTILTGDYQVPLNGFVYNFTTPANTAGKVIIGRTVCTSGQARLTVADDNIGMGIHGSSSTLLTDNIGIKGSGLDLSANSVFTTYGVVGEARQPNMSASALSAGVAGFCGGWSSASMPPGENIGVYGNSTASGGRWAGYFDGDVSINGQGWLNNFPIVSSDKRYKKNIIQLEDVITKISKINGYNYEYKTEEFSGMNFSKTKQIGFIAQELKEVFPELVTENKKGFLAVNYEGMVPVLVEVAKNQQKQIEELRTMVQTLLASATGDKIKNVNSVELSDKNAIVLNQNVPNPFAESTVITYNIPSDFAKAQIIFTTNEGKLIKTFDITVKGTGSLNVFANDLTHGLYTYSLVVDGKTIDTKSMIKE
jgi:hypothetical protein